MRIGVGAIGLLLVIAATAASASDIHRQLLAEPESLDPQLITGSTDFDVVEDLFEGLTAQAADGSIAPGLAEAWDTSGDRLSWTFHLRPGLRWSDGTDLKADDFVWAMRRAVDPKTASPYAAALGPLKNARAAMEGKAPPSMLGVSAPDSRTVRIDLEEPTPFLPGLLAQPVTYALPRAAIEHWGEQWTRQGHIVSSGAFTLQSWTPESEIVLLRNPAYHDPAPTDAPTVKWLLADDRKAGLRRYLAGELDSAALSAEDYPWATQHRAAELHSTPLLATRYLVVNMAGGPLADRVGLGRALSYAIDRPVLTGQVDRRGQRPAWSLVPPGMSGYAAPAIGEPRETAAEARRLFAAEGAGSKPLKITLLIEHDDVDRRIAEAVRAMWQQSLPVEITLEEHEWRVFNAQFHQGNFQIALFGWYADYADPWNFLANWRSDAGPLNPGRYRSKEYDELLDRAKTSDGADRMPLMEAAERQLLADCPVIPLEFPVSQKLVSPRIRGWEADPFDMNLSRFLSIAPPAGHDNSRRGLVGSPP